MSHLEALRQAKYAYEHKDNFDREARVVKVIELAEWGVFSNSQISAFTGMRTAEVGNFTGKKDRTGGTLNPEALGNVIGLVIAQNNDVLDVFEWKAALDAGVSSTMLARLTGVGQTTISARIRRATAIDVKRTELALTA